MNSVVPSLQHFTVSKLHSNNLELYEIASALYQVEPVGRWFEAFVKRRNRNASTSFQELEDKKELSEGSEDEELQLEEFPMLKTLDPKDWKNQDHYAVLGLGHVRYKATQRQIKAAHKAMVLKHHPDKRKAAGEPIKEGDNDYFTCITKAYEMLSDPVKRRAFNSVDPTFDNSVPSKSEAKDNFFQVFSPVFERNSRYNFDSWREFSYLDEEEKEKAECRDERRWIEKQNRATRAQRKKEEMNRIRTLVDNAYSCDPRIKKFKEEEKAKKEAEKKAKAEARRKEQAAKEKQRQAELEAARLAKEKEEEEVRQQALLAKKEKDIQKKAIKKERQKLRNSCKIEEVNEQMRKEKEEADARMRQASKNAEKSTGGSGSGSKNWSEDDLQLLIKAVNLFPAGTNSRWEVIANYMNIHSSSGIKRTAKDVIGKAKSLQKLDPHQKDDINKKAFDKFKKEHGVAPQADKAAPSERFEGPCTDFTPWTTEEQKLLEQALKTYPVNTPERWEKIAEAVPGRTKKDCMRRYKELVEMVKAKKAAQEQVLNASRAKK
ncbi:putative dnaJ subfamily C member 2-like protein [Cricetulus griseus]|nr:putative dnaJ subfamily C member 2-like protein [Cricetulus griseus]